MPDEREHAAECLEKLGQPFTKVHVWLDQFFRVYWGMPHRIILHHRLGVELAGLIFGPEAREAARLHILADAGELPLGPEYYLALPYKFNQGEAGNLQKHLAAMLGYDLDLSAGRTEAQSCPCGYQGYFLTMDAGEACPWCRGRGLDLATRFGILAELAAGHRFCKLSPTAEQIETVKAGLWRAGRCPE